MLNQPRPLVPFVPERRLFRWYRLRDQFITTASAPLGSPRTCEPGPGTLALVQTDGQFSISSGRLSYPAQASAAWGDQGFYEPNGFARSAGLALVAAHRYSTLSSGSIPLAWFTLAGLNTTAGNNQAAGFGINSTALFAQHLGVIIGAAGTTGVDYQYALVLRNTGAFMFVKGAGFTQWTLVFVDALGTQTPLYPGVSNYNTVGTLDDFRVTQLYAPFDTDYGIATVHTAAASGSDYAAHANLIADIAITAPGTLANSAGLKFRKSGGDYWQVHFDSSGALILQRYAANVAQGSPITLASGVITGSATRLLRVIADGSSMDFYTLAGSTWTKRAGTQTDSVLSANSGISPFATGSWSLGTLDAYPRAGSLYDIFDHI